MLLKEFQSTQSALYSTCRPMWVSKWAFWPRSLQGLFSLNNHNSSLKIKNFAVGEWYSCRGLALVANSGISTSGLGVLHPMGGWPQCTVGFLPQITCSTHMAKSYRATFSIACYIYSKRIYIYEYFIAQYDGQLCSGRSPIHMKMRNITKKRQ